jgi:hypothetical protein
MPIRVKVPLQKDVFKNILDKTLLVVLALKNNWINNFTLPRVLQKDYVRYYLLNINTKVFAYLSEWTLNMLLI